MTDPSHTTGPASAELERQPVLDMLVHDLEVQRQQLRAQESQISQTRSLLEASHNQYLDLYDYAPLGYLTLDGQGVVHGINLTGASLLGVQRDRILGHPLLPFVVPDDRSRFLEHMRRCRHAATIPVVSELTLQARTGQVLPVQLSARPTPSQLDENRYHTAITDLSVRKRMEDELRESRRRLDKLNRALNTRATQLRNLALKLFRAEEQMRRQFAADLHDDLGQLLVAAKMKLTALGPDADPQAVRRTINQVVEILTQASRSVRSLTFEASPPVLHELGLIPALEWLAQHMQEQFNLMVRFEHGDQIPQLDHDLRLLVFRSVRELLINVAKHAQVDRAALHVQENDGHLWVSVRDNGRGFDPEAAAGDGSDEKGFGLFSISERVEPVGGQVEIESRPGRGTSITMRVPLQATSPGQGAPAHPAPGFSAATAHAPPQSLPARAIRVLLADDHRVVRDGLASILEDEPDIQVVGEADDGQAAVELAREKTVDVILMDVNMPRLNGIEATRQIMRAHPDVRIIGLSMHEDPSIGAAMRQAGAAAYLTKDGASDRLLAAIRSQGRSEACES